MALSEKQRREINRKKPRYVSIRPRRFGRGRLAVGAKFDWATVCFNPPPAFRPGETDFEGLDDLLQGVSIRPRRFGRGRQPGNE